jgi:hypothetical protein
MISTAEVILMVDVSVYFAFYCAVMNGNADEQRVLIVTPSISLEKFTKIEARPNNI